LNISCWISHWANWAPDRIALRFEGRSTTYAELERRVAGLAGFLAKSGLAPGDRVAYLGPNCPELLETLFAAARIGAIFVPLNARMPPAELRVFVEQSEPRLLVAEEGFVTPPSRAHRSSRPETSSCSTQTGSSRTSVMRRRWRRIPSWTGPPPS
jgi:acyl-CoA synthetase (AMP-forming)/AMP-acid ligase II